MKEYDISRMGLVNVLVPAYEALKKHQRKLKQEADAIVGKVSDDCYRITRSKARTLLAILGIIQRELSPSREGLKKLQCYKAGVNPVSGCRSVKLFQHRYRLGKILQVLSFGLYKPKSERCLNAMIEAYRTYLSGG